MGDEVVPVPEVDRGALVMADLAWVEAGGTLASKTRAAIAAYLWSVEYEQRHGHYPSLDALREQVISPAAPVPESDRGGGE